MFALAFGVRPMCQSKNGGKLCDRLLAAVALIAVLSVASVKLHAGIHLMPLKADQ